MTHLVDTNVISELFRPEPDDGVVEWARGISSIAISSITIDEIWYGLERRSSDTMRRHVESFVDERCTVMAVTREVARQSGILRARLSRRGRIVTQADMMIACTAMVHGMTLVTRNIRHFRGCPVPLLDPFTS